MEETIISLKILFLNVFAFILPSLYFLNFFEKKIIADYQSRVGPHLTGLNGFGQIFWDLLKTVPIICLL